MSDFEKLTKAIFAKYSERGENLTPRKEVEFQESGPEGEKITGTPNLVVDNIMTRTRFSLLTSKLHKTSSKHPRPSVPKEVSLDLSNAVFALLAGSNHFLLYEDFEGWWSSSTRFIYFTDEEKGSLIVKAFGLMKSFGTRDPVNGTLFLEAEGFSKMMRKLKKAVDDRTFESLDSDDNGRLSFRELFQWLGWGPFP